MTADIDNTNQPRHAGDPEISIVLPSFNEVGLLGSTVTNLLTGTEARGLDVEIIIVENGSSDGTLRLARLLAAQLDRVRVLSLPRGNYGAALVAGFRAARGDVVFTFDVDYYDLAFIDRALLLLHDDAALVVASKRAPGSLDRRPRSRRLLTYSFAMILRLTLELPVSDAHGMKAMRRDLVGPVVDLCKVRGNLYDVELVVRAARAGLVTRELPATVVERRPPRSSVNRRAFATIFEIARLKILLEREDRAHRPSTPPVAPRRSD